MFEKEIKFITDFSLEKIKSLGPYFSFKDILSTDIHPSITKYISAELSFLIYEDRQKLLSSSVFNYSDTNVFKLLKSVDNELKKNKSISFQDMKKLVLQSVSFNANFVLRPKWSLVKLIYNESETKSAEEIILMMNYIYYHEYLGSIVTEYIEKKKLSSISKDKFEEIILKIDTALIQKDLKSYIDNSFAAMLEFFGIGGKNKVKIDTDYIEIFLKEKNLIEQLMKLKKTFGKGIVKDIEEIKEVIFSDKISADIEQSNIAFKKEKDEKPLIKENEVEKTAGNIESEKNEIDQSENIGEEIIETNESTKIIDDSTITEKDELLNTENDDELLTLFDKELKALSEESNLESDIHFSINEESNVNVEENELVESEDTENKNNLDLGSDVNNEIPESNEFPTDDVGQIQSTGIDEEYEESNFIEGIPDDTLSTEEQDIREDEDITEQNNNETKPEIETVTKPKRENDIFHYLSDKEIEKIVSNVFNEDREDFATTLEKVSECESFEEANEIIKGVYISYRVNMYTKDASTLTNAISKYFNQ